jgi:hypothetical protein
MPNVDQEAYEDDDAPPRKSKRGAVVIFLIGWLCLPLFAVLLSELEAPWLQIASVAMLAFIVVLIGAMVQVVRRF